MVGEQQRARRVITSYMAAQLQTGLATMEAALSLGNTELFFEAAKKYAMLADIARKLYSEDELKRPDAQQSHNWRALTRELQKDTGIVVQRQRRLPHVFGDAQYQLKILQDILLLLGAREVTLTFRQRGDDLVMGCRGELQIPEELLVAGSRQVLMAAARRPSLAAIQGYLLARRSQLADMRIVVAQNSVFIHFQVVRQLKMPFDGVETRVLQ